MRWELDSLAPHIYGHKKILGKYFINGGNTTLPLNRI
jgi:hypothetical protein